MKTPASGLPFAAAAIGLVAVMTLVQGLLTNRWGGTADRGDLEQAARVLEQVFPQAAGEWEFAEAIESDPKELARAGAVGHISRVYRSTKTKRTVSTFVVCAAPHDASGHTPDRCYPGAGFEIAESEHRETVPLADGREAEAFTGTFRKSGQTLRIFWTYGIRPQDAEGGIAASGPHAERNWIAPGIARIALQGEPAVYKLYAIIDQTSISGAQATAEGAAFLAAILPALDAAVVAAQNAAPQGASVAPAAGAGSPDAAG